MIELAVLISALAQDDGLAAWNQARRRFVDEPTEARWLEMVDAYEEAYDIVGDETGEADLDSALWDGPWTMAALGETVLRNVVYDGLAPADWLVNAVEEQYVTYQERWDDDPPDGVDPNSMQRSMLDAVTLWSDLVVASEALDTDPSRYESFLHGSVITIARDGGDSPEMVEAITTFTALAFGTDDESARIVDALERIEAADPAEAGAAFHNVLYDRAVELWEAGDKEAAVDHFATINDSYEIWGDGYWEDEADDHKRAYLFRANWALDQGDFEEAQLLLDTAHSLGNVRQKTALLRTEARLVELRDGYVEFHGNGDAMLITPQQVSGTSWEPEELVATASARRPAATVPGNPAKDPQSRQGGVPPWMLIGSVVVILAGLVVGYRLLKA